MEVQFAPINQQIIMNKIISTSLLLLLLARETSAQIPMTALQKEVINYIDKNKSRFTALSDSIWQYAEPSFKEYKSTRLIIETLKQEGFRIKENLVGFATVFIAEYGNGKPVIGLYGEYDADPNASNKAVPYRDELVKGGMGHGGGHNLLGAGSVATALAIKNMIKEKKMNCTIRYYGSTAEGTLGTRAWLAKAGYFNDLDVSIYWHPAPVSAASTHTWDALIDFTISIASEKVDFVRGNIKSNNCQHAAETILSTISELRKSANESSKINYTIKSWKNELRHTPDSILLDVRIQCSRQTPALEMFSRIKDKINSVIDSNVTCSIMVNRAHHQFLPNVAAMKQVFENMLKLGPIAYSNEDLVYTQQMQEFINKKNEPIADRIIAFNEFTDTVLYNYSSDIGEASWFAPEIYFVVKCFPGGINMHHWQGTAFTGQSIGHKGMLQAAKIMAMTIIDFVQKPDLQKNIRKQFEANRKNYKYLALVNNIKQL